MKKLLIVLVSLLCLSSGAEYPWSIVQGGDNHGQGFITNVVRWIHTNRNDGFNNVRGYLSGGDIYNSESEGAEVLTNAFNDLYNDGVWCFISNGNHDSGNTNSTLPSGATLTVFPWDNYFPVSWYQRQTNITGVRFVTNRYAGTSMWIAMTYSNSPQNKFIMVTVPWATNLFVPDNSQIYSNTVNAAYADSVSWALSILDQYKDWKGIVGSHFWLSARRLYDYWDLGNSMLYSNIGLSGAWWANGGAGATNSWLLFGGHNRAWIERHRMFYLNDGQAGIVSQWNTQFFTGGNGMFRIITFLDGGTILFRAYDANNDRWITNGQIFNGGAYTNNWKVAAPGAKRILKLQ